MVSVRALGEGRLPDARATTTPPQPIARDRPTRARPMDDLLAWSVAIWCPQPVSKLRPRSTARRFSPFIQGRGGIAHQRQRRPGLRVARTIDEARGGCIRDGHPDTQPAPTLTATGFSPAPLLCTTPRLIPARSHRQDQPGDREQPTRAFEVGGYELAGDLPGRLVHVLQWSDHTNVDVGVQHHGRDRLMVASTASAHTTGLATPAVRSSIAIATTAWI